MKTIKVILVIITILTVAFFATGIVINETNYTTQITVNKPVEEVFATFTKQEDIKNWIPEIKSIEVTNKTLGKTGSTYKIVLDNQGQEIVMTEKVMAYVPNEKITLFFDAENMLKTDDYSFTENDGTTTITLNATCVSESYIMGCMFPYFKGVFKAQSLEYLNNFKAFVEKEKL